MVTAADAPVILSPARHPIQSMPTRQRSTRRRFHPRTAAKLAWPRFWARQFDNAICWWVAAGVATFLGMASPLRGRNVLIAVLVGPVVVGVLHLIYEVLVLTILGTTIGKSVFGLRVETQRGKRVDVKHVIDRSVGAWLHGSYGYLLFPFATLHAWKKARDRLRAEGLTEWDTASETEVTGPALPLWHLSVGAALAVAAFAMVVAWQTTGRVDAPSVADTDVMNPVTAGSIRPALEPSPIADSEIGIVQNGRASFPPESTQKSFVIRMQSGRPGTDKTVETLALWAERTYPYLAQDGPARRAMFSWMVAGTRVGMSRSEGLALGIDTVIAGRDNGLGVCWPADLPPDRIPTTAAGNPQQKALGIHCEH
jgi:uncharacterized RDD family membrane protein YckC